MDKFVDDGLDIVEILQDDKYRGRFSHFEPGRGRSKCRCPFHNEDTPSFIIFHETNSFYCFGCKKGGGVIKLIQFLEEVDFKTAEKIFNSYLSPEKVLEIQVKKKLNKTGESNIDINTRFSTFCRKFYKKRPDLVGLLDTKICEFDKLLQSEPETHLLAKKSEEITNYLADYARKNKTT